MNQSNTSPSLAAFETLQSRFALRVAAGLTERAEALGSDLSERLRFAREQALERGRAARPAAASPQLGVTPSGAAVLGQSGWGWWSRIGAVAPVFALVSGLFFIQTWQDKAQISVAAEIDAALLADDLPPKAYSDAGFAEFLKAPRE